MTPYEARAARISRLVLRRIAHIDWEDAWWAVTGEEWPRATGADVRRRSVP